MAAKNPLERPDNVTVPCKLCGQPLEASFHWVYDRWLRPTVHDQCAQDWERRHSNGAQLQVVERPIPERFARFEPGRADPGAVDACAGFSPAYPHHALALIGPPGTGKSRLMWGTVKAFFDMLRLETGADRWPDYYISSDLMTESDRTVFARLKEARYVFIDDIGATDSFGRARTQIQDIIRARIQKGLGWTFLTIDNPDFDPGFQDLFRDRALVVYLK